MWTLQVTPIKSKLYFRRAWWVPKTADNTNSSLSCSFLCIDLVDFNIKFLQTKGLTTLCNHKIKQLQKNIFWGQIWFCSINKSLTLLLSFQLRNHFMSSFKYGANVYPSNIVLWCHQWTGQPSWTHCNTTTVNLKPP